MSWNDLILRRAHSTRPCKISLPSSPPNIDVETIVGNLIELFKNCLKGIKFGF